MHLGDSDDPRLIEMREWLETVLGPGAGAPVPASEDASFRRYFRVRDGDRTFVVMDAPPEREDCGPFLQVLALLVDAGVNAPRVHAADRQRGFLVLDDLGSECYLDRLGPESADALYADAFDSLVRMQRAVPAAGLPAYDRPLVRRELELFPEWFLERHLGIAVDDRIRDYLEETFPALEAIFDEQPQTFVHRDFHSRNLMVTATSNPGVIDFQDAVRGPIAYDLVSLLRDVYVRWPAARVAAWVDRYHERAIEAGLLGAADGAALHRWFDLTGVQRHLKVAGIFARLHHRDGKPRYLADLPLTLDYLAEVVPRHPETRKLAALMDELRIAERVDRGAQS